MSERRIDESSIGETLQRLRQARGLSLRTLASLSRFSPSFLSQVENGQTSPSIASLDRLADALGLTLADFFEQIAISGGPIVLRATERQALRSGWSKARFAPMVPHGALKGLEGVLITLAPGGRSGKGEETLRYEQLVLVTEGAVRLIIGGLLSKLSTGDAAAIPAGCAHRWENPTSEAATLAIVTVRHLSPSTLKSR